MFHIAWHTVIYIHALYLLATVFAWPVAGLGDQAERNPDSMEQICTHFNTSF